MRCICERMCQVRIAGKIHTIDENTVLEFDECPEYFRPLGKALEDKKVSDITDFDAISREELLEVDGDVEQLKKYLKKNYPDIQFASNIGWDTLVFRYIEARENQSTIIDNTGKRKNTIVEVRAAIDEEADDDMDELDKILGE